MSDFMLSSITNIGTRFFVRALFTDAAGQLEPVTLTPAQINRLNLLIHSLTKNRQTSRQNKKSSLRGLIVHKLKSFGRKINLF